MTGILSRWSFSFIANVVGCCEHEDDEQHIIEPPTRSLLSGFAHKTFFSLSFAQHHHHHLSFLVLLFKPKPESRVAREEHR